MMKCRYPEYQVDLTPETLSVCRDVAQRLLEEVGIEVDHEGFRAALEGRDGVRIVEKRIHLDRALTDRLFEAYIKAQKTKLEAAAAVVPDTIWSLSCDGFSIMVIDNETDQVREATRQDLRDSIRLVRSFGMKGSYPCTPQDVPPLMRALACFKICWEEADNIRPFDYLDIRQTPFLYEMHEVMEKPMTIVVNIVEPMAISPHDLEIFLRFYPLWKRQPSRVSFYNVCDYPMLGVTKPVTSTGALTCYLSQSFGTSFLFSLFDPELNVPPRLLAGFPVDLRTMNWAWGSPRFHLYHFLNSQAVPALCGLRPGRYAPASAPMSTSSCAVDLRSGMEKMASALMGALQGARHFSGAGNLAVDDLFSGIQLVADVEIFEYVKEVVESFSPHPDLLATEGLYEVLREVGLRTDEFYSHPDTAAKVRHLLPASARRPCDKLRVWMTDPRNLKDRLRAECLERIRKQPPFTLAEDKRRALDQIYTRAEKELCA